MLFMTFPQGWKLVLIKWILIVFKAILENVYLSPGIRTGSSGSIGSKPLQVSSKDWNKSINNLTAQSGKKLCKLEVLSTFNPFLSI